MFSVHTTLETFEKGVFTLRTYQMFSVHTTLETFEKRSFHSKDVSNVFRPHYAGDI